MPKIKNGVCEFCGKKIDYLSLRCENCDNAFSAGYDFAKREFENKIQYEFFKLCNFLGIEIKIKKQDRVEG